MASGQASSLTEVDKALLNVVAAAGGNGIYSGAALNIVSNGMGVAYPDVKARALVLIRGGRLRIERGRAPGTKVLHVVRPFRFVWGVEGFTFPGWGE